MKATRTFIPIFLLGLAVLAGCSLRGYQGPTIKVLFEQGAKKFDLSSSPSFFGTPVMSALPGNFDGFSCYLVNVMGDGIQNHPYTNGSPMPFEALGNDCNWYLGIPSQVGASYTASFEVNVPIGARRAIQFLGIDSSVGCTAGAPFTQFFDGPQQKKSSFEGAYALGMTKLDIFSTQTVTVQNEFNYNTAVNGATCHENGGTFGGPGSIPGLVLWVRGDEFLGQSNGYTPSSWVDQSGQGNTLSAAGSPPPTYYLSTSMNNHGIVRFGGGTGNFTQSAAAGVSSMDGVTLILVASHNAPTMPTKHLFTASSTNTYTSSPYSFGLAGAYSGGVIKNNAAVTIGSTPLTSAEEPTATVNTPLVITLQGASVSYSTGVRLYVNGQGYTGGTTATDTLNGISHLVVGSSLNGGTGLSSFDGDIAEVILYDHELGDNTRAAIECQLGEKYGITISGHPCP